MVKNIRITIKREDGAFINELSSTRDVKSIIKEVAKEGELKFLEECPISDGIVNMIVTAYKIGVKDVNRNIKSDEAISSCLNGFEEKITVEVE